MNINNQSNIEHFNLECLRKLVPCKTCQGLITQNNVKEHSERCVKLQKDLDYFYMVQKCNNCFCYFQELEFEIHLEKCGYLPHNVFKDEIKEQILNIEKLLCEFCGLEILLIDLSYHEEKCRRTKLRYNEYHEKRNNIKEKIPSEWGEGVKDLKIVSSFINIITLTTDSFSYQTCLDLINNKVKVSNIKRIQNEILWTKFVSEKESIIKVKGECTEMLLFHGTRQTNPEIIFEKGFDISFSNDKGSYGRGLYFAMSIDYSKNYAYFSNNKGYIFIAKVLVGKSKICKPGKYEKPPVYDEIPNNINNKILYDSITNIGTNKLANQMFVVYENEKAYPYYLIEYDI